MKGLTWIACGAVLAGSLAMTTKARADVQLAADFDIGVPIDVSSPTSVPLATGAGFDVRLGFRFRIPRSYVYLTPEIAGGYTDLGARFIRVRPGLRLGIGRIVTPYVYGHVGWGWTSYEDRFAPQSTLPGRTVGDVPRQTGQGAVFDAGVGLDVRVMRRLTIGAHVGYNVVGVGNPATIDLVGSTPAVDHPKWFNLGLNASVFF